MLQTYLHNAYEAIPQKGYFKKKPRSTDRGPGLDFKGENLIYRNLLCSNRFVNGIVLLAAQLGRINVE